MKIRDRIVELRRVHSSDLIPCPDNWRSHPDYQVDAMKAVLAEIGIAGAVLARETEEGLQLIDGHLRADIDSDIEWPVLVLDVNEEEARKILLTFDHISSLAVVEEEALDRLKAGVKFESEVLASLVAEVSEEEPCEVEGSDDDYESPDARRLDELEEKWAVQPGDVWEVGRHRLICGDSTDPEQIKRLMDGKTAGAGFTSPPYNAGGAYTGAYTGGSENRKDVTALYESFDDSLTDEEYKEFIFSVLENCAAVMDEDAVLGWNVAYNANSRRAYGEIIFSDRCPVPVQETVVWDKGMGMNISADRAYTRTAEFVFLLCKTKKYKSNQNGGVYQNIWRITSHDGDKHKKGHGATFPVELPKRFLLQHSNEGDIVFEPFAGTGTTMLAAERMARTCYGVEMSPRYAAVCLERLSDSGIDRVKKCR